MESNQDKLLKLFKKIGQNHKTIDDKIGQVTTLRTTAKSDVVSALNELKTTIDSIQANPNGVTESLVDQKIKALETKIMGGENIDQALDTLKEISEKIKADNTVAASLLQGLSNRVRIDENQVLTDPQLRQVYKNLQLGNPDADFNKEYEDGLAGR